MNHFNGLSRYEQPDFIHTGGGSQEGAPLNQQISFVEDADTEAR